MKGYFAQFLSWDSSYSPPPVIGWKRKDNNSKTTHISIVISTFRESVSDGIQTEGGGGLFLYKLKYSLPIHKWFLISISILFLNALNFSCKCKSAQNVTEHFVAKGIHCLLGAVDGSIRPEQCWSKRSLAMQNANRGIKCLQKYWF